MAECEHEECAQQLAHADFMIEELLTEVEMLRARLECLNVNA